MSQHDEHNSQSVSASDSSILHEPTETRLPPLGPQFFNTIPSTYLHRGTLTQVPPLPPILDPSLRDLPFLHQGRTGTYNPISYERLEFLGDAYIELVARRIIYAHFPTMTAGRMSQKRERVVRNEVLAEYAMAYGFHQKARLPSGFAHGGKNQEKSWSKVYGDIFEAYVAAVVLGDPGAGFATIEAWLTELWAPRLFGDDGFEEPENPEAKVLLAQRLGGKGVVIKYRPEKPVEFIRKEGKEMYHIGVYCTGWGWTHHRLGRGLGLSVKEAGVRAAMQALENPVTEQIAAKKKEHDVVTRAKREEAVSQGVEVDGKKEYSTTDG